MQLKPDNSQLERSHTQMSASEQPQKQAPTSAVTFRSSIPIKPEDLDYLVMFLESKKQSGGGDITHTSRLDSRTLRVVYESRDACDRVLKKRFLRFKNYLLVTSIFDRNNNASSADVASLMTRTFELEPRTLIIRNLNIFDENGKQDAETIKLYGEHLVAETNNVVGMEFPFWLTDTVYVSYENAIDRALLKQRYEKKPTVRQRRIELYGAFVTNTFIVFNTEKSPAKKHSSSMVKSKIVNVIRESKKDDSDEICYFIECSNNYILLEFGDEVEEELIFSLRMCLVNIDDNLVIEALYNFELLKFVDDEKRASCFEVSSSNETTNVVVKSETKPTVATKQPAALLPTPNFAGLFFKDFSLSKT
jgi:hypothetical protein